MEARPAPYQPKTPISLCLISKNERKNIKPFFESVRPLLTHPQDEIVLVDTGSVDNTEKTARELGWRVYQHPELSSVDLVALAKEVAPEHWEKWGDHRHLKGGFLRSFAEARQLSFDYANNPTCMWLDLDDTLIGAENLREYVDQCFCHPQAEWGGIYLPYDYARRDSDDQCIAHLWRERIVSKSNWRWKGACHECLVLVDQNRPGGFVARDPDFPAVVRHNHKEESRFCDLRNYVILRAEYEKQEKKDPRTELYLGNAASGLGEWDEALRWHETFLKHSGSEHDCYLARIYRSNAYGRKGRWYRAIEELQEAQRISPRDPRAYYGMANAWFQLKNYRNALTCIKLGDQMPKQEYVAAHDPSTLNTNPAAIGYYCARELEQVDLALAFARRAVEARPGWKEAHANLEDAQRWAMSERGAEAVMQTLSLARSKDKQRTILQQLDLGPYLADKGLGTPEAEVPGAATGKQTISFYCGSGGDPWGPSSVEDGVGASEKMVVDLAKRLVGDFEVSVYCKLKGEEGCYDGVHWRKAGHFNDALRRDYVVLWRLPQALEKNEFNAGKVFVWMHDCSTDTVWTPTVLSRLDKVLFLSKFQRGLHPSVPEEKVAYTRNGIDLERHLYDGTPKQKKIIFCSSPERGWMTAIRVFKDSGLAEKGYELHLFYGFNGYWRRWTSQSGFGYVVELDESINLLEYEDACLAAAEEVPGVVNRGRVGWDELAKEMKEAEVWLYPTRFDEISCVSAMEAMAAGCKVVATDHAALAETLDGYGGWLLLNEDKRAEWAEGLWASIMTTEPSPGRWAEHAHKFDIEKLAQQWKENLFGRSEQDSERPAAAA